jgi:predicted small metal-binding protein
MKKMICADMGGPATCTDEISGSTADEMIQHGWKHIEEMHPEIAEGIKNNPK